VLVECRVLALLVRCRDELVALILEPFANAELVLSSTKEFRLVAGVLMTLHNIDISHGHS